MKRDLFWLGTHRINWLWSDAMPEEVPLFVSYHGMMDRASFSPITRRWALDSGGFSEIKRHGHWTISPERYVADIRWFMDNLGGLEWAAPQDWMCEPFMLAKTGLTIGRHQQKTTDNFLRLRTLDADLPIVPVLQGWVLDDYLDHVERYARYGVDLRDEALVGIGSVCKRQHTSEIGEIVSAVAALGIRLHGFGVKTTGLAMYEEALTSADSLAWSFQARYSQLNWCGSDVHKNCANCEIWALEWRERVLEQLPKSIQEVTV